MENVLVMMSGGVDSSVAAAILIEAGHRVTGVTLRLADSPPDSARVGGCCSLSDVEDARCVAHHLGISHYSLNEKDLFRETVLRNFEEEYRAGRTPNPCFRCNQFVKFDFVLNWGLEMGFDRVATGHYARIEERCGRRFLCRGVDPEKDQSYFLASVPPRALDRMNFPVGRLTKPEVREEAERLGLVTADKEESQELCFAHDLDYRNALAGGVPGEIVDKEGNRLGGHGGIINYTIGQRKGLGLAGGPYYVIQLDPVSNQVVAGKEEDLFSDEVEVGELNRFRQLEEGEILTGMPRYRHPGADVQIEKVEGDRMRLRFLEPQKALTPGQVLALYDGDRLVAGSVIDRVGPFRGVKREEARPPA